MSDSPWLSDAQQGTWRSWLRVTSLLDTVLAEQTQDYGLSLPDFAVLALLSEQEGHRARISDLAEMLQWERSRLSHHLTRMTRRGLVSRETCDTDARGAFASVTEKGMEAVTECAPGHARLVRALMFDDSAGSLQGFDAHLREVQRRLESHRPAEPQGPRRAADY